MGAQRDFWMRIGGSLIVSLLGLLLLSWYLDGRAQAEARAAEPLQEASLPALQSLEPLPGALSGLPLRAVSHAERLELVPLPEGASVSTLPCLIDLRPEGLFLRRPEQATARIFLRSPPVAELEPMQRACLLQALEELLQAWSRDPSELDLPPGEAFRTLALWMQRDPIPLSRR